MYVNSKKKQALNQHKEKEHAIKYMYKNHKLRISPNAISWSFPCGSQGSSLSGPFVVQGYGQLVDYRLVKGKKKKNKP